MQAFRSADTATPGLSSGERTKATPATEWGLQDQQGWATKTWGGPEQAEDVELGILMLAPHLCVVEGLRVEWEDRERRTLSVDPSSSALAPHAAHSERPKACRPTLLRKFPTTCRAQHDSWGSHLLPNVLSKASFDIMCTVLPERSSGSCKLPSSLNSL